MQLQFKNRVSLNPSEGFFRIKLRRTPGSVDVNLPAAKISDQVFTRISAVRAGPNDSDHIVEMIKRSEIAFENMLAVFRFRQQISSTPPNDIDPVINKKLDGLNKSQLFWLSIYDSQKDHAETFLHRGVLE